MLRELFEKNGVYEGTLNIIDYGTLPKPFEDLYFEQLRMEYYHTTTDYVGIGKTEEEASENACEQYAKENGFKESLLLKSINTKYELKLLHIQKEPTLIENEFIYIHHIEVQDKRKTIIKLCLDDDDNTIMVIPNELTRDKLVCLLYAKEIKIVNDLEGGE